MKRGYLMGAACALVLGLAVSSAKAAIVEVRDDRIEAAVSAGSMSRIVVEGDRVVSVRQMGDEETSPLMIEVEPSTGDAYVGFSEGVEGRSFTVYLVTQSGRTVQAQLRPVTMDAQTLTLRLPRPNTPSGESVQRTDKRAGYQQVIAGLVRVMFNGDAVDGVRMRAMVGRARFDGPLDAVVMNAFEAPGLRAFEVRIRNRTKETQPVVIDRFLVAGVIAAASDRDSLAPGESGRVFVVEEQR